MHKFTDPNQVTIGTFLGMGAPMAAEIAAVGGVDWVLVDLEHGGAGEDVVGPTLGKEAISSGLCVFQKSANFKIIFQTSKLYSALPLSSIHLISSPFRKRSIALCT
jgi:hypothetical protein